MPSGPSVVRADFMLFNSFPGRSAASSTGADSCFLNDAKMELPKETYNEKEQGEYDPEQNHSDN